ncbi:MAG: AAA family ATPase, partial [Acidimicrobiales bacterium]
MRPERLELEGFTAFRSPVTVEFGDCDLFAFVGPTGSGKSSLIDAIVFALYGSIPRYDDRRLVAPAISQGLVQARVRLDFAVGAERYTAVRVVRAGKDGRASTREARLERRLADGGVEVLAGEADEVTRGVEALLGLSYEHFTTCVVLPQGEFARFLHHKPRDRQALLIRLLELGLYERMGQLARARAAAAAGGREAVGRRLAELAPVTEEVRAALAARVQSLDSLLEQVDKAKPELDALATELDAAAAAAAAAERDAALLAGVAPPEDLPGLAAELAAADAELAAAAAELEGAEVALGAVEAEVEAPGAARLAPEDAARLLGARTEAAQQAKLASKG